MKRLLEYVGYDPGRFNARWISGSEGQKWADTNKQITENIKALGPNQRFSKK